MGNILAGLSKLIRSTPGSRFSLCIILARRISRGRTSTDLIVIDEVHNFRNSDSLRYTNLAKIPKTNACFALLTATPMNNSYLDLYNIITIFHDEDVFKQNGIEQEFHALKEYVKMVEIPMRKIENEEDFIAFLQENESKIQAQKEIMKHLRRELFIQTTRSRS